jgi:hypothetical protein
VNPEFELDADGQQFSFIETALYLGMFGNVDDGNARTDWVRVMFGKVPHYTTLSVLGS